ncbi:MAG: hypothetical protein HYS07_05105 [Chlamydiae bacterium]|nr:hypothetical protein [Chlamydiota bacterium]MBI3276131.1 hypothetical protein [Chlamydiota bacterium]
MMEKIKDEFLSEEDLDLRNLSEEELFAYWDMWLEQAQLTNEYDKNSYSHGVFAVEYQNGFSRERCWHRGYSDEEI